MIDPFSWLRRKAAEAIVSGVADGVRAVTPEGESPPADLADLAELRALLANSVQPKALPAAKVDAGEAEGEPVKGKRTK